LASSRQKGLLFAASTPRQPHPASHSHVQWEIPVPSRLAPICAILIPPSVQPSVQPSAGQDPPRQRSIFLIMLARPAASRLSPSPSLNNILHALNVPQSPKSPSQKACNRPQLPVPRSPEPCFSAQSGGSVPCC
jgi:hypothetical protein